MRVTRPTLAVALTVAVSSGAFAGCSSDESSGGSSGSSANGGSAGSGNAGSGAVGGEGGAAAGGSGNGGNTSGGAGSGGTANGGGAGSSGAASGGSGGALSCPTFADGVSVGNVANSQVTEASGLVASRKQSDVFWLHNDSGDSARVFALKSDGTDLGVFNLSGASATDWEDIALGPGPTSGTDYLYLADIGDNSAQRAFVRVYRLAEPTVGTGGTQDVAGAEALEFEYPDGAHNAETLLSDPLTGDLIIVTKGLVSSGIYRAPAPQTVGRTTLTYEGDATGVMTQLVTGGDISPDGRYIALRTYGAVHLYLRNSGVSVADALKAAPCEVPQAAEGQGEAVAFAADGGAYFTVSEGNAQPIWRFAKQ